MRHPTIVLAAALLGPFAQAQEPPGQWTFAADLLRPFWLSTTMHEESVLFVKDEAAELLFAPVKILSVRDSSGRVTYQEGKDYVLKPGARSITLPAGSAIRVSSPQDLRRPAKSQQFNLTHRDGGDEILFGGGHEYHDLQTLITYEHRPGAWAGSVPKFAEKLLPRTLARLKEKKPLAITLLGDSISTGCNASGWAKTAPFQPAYPELFAMNLESAYGAKVTVVNLAVGGTTSAWGLQTIGKVIEAKPDLVILAFGMNDAGGVPAADYQANTKGMLAAVGKALPEAECILVASMLGNEDWTALRRERFPEFRDALAALVRPGVALADMTTVWIEMRKRKKDRDLTGNGVNHPNDFGHRVYAQVLSSLLIRYPARD